MTEISNKEKLITIFKNTLPTLSIDSILMSDDCDAFILNNHKEEWSIDVYKNGCYQPTDYIEDDDAADCYIQYDNHTEAYMNNSIKKGRSGYGNLQFVCREPLTLEEFNELLCFTKDVLSKAGKSFGDANIDSIYNQIKNH
jgi:hypothetical protein